MIETSEVRVDLGDDGVLSIPFVNVVGEAGDGPHLTVIAGVHGTEYTSIAAARELIAELGLWRENMAGCRSRELLLSRSPSLR